ncbi:FHA domain-containing protein [Actinomyces trachealis]|uniref:FHA domain-containing protein n=1 Tax=Actinomyces trachealis TaxID=2763540 RepID=UPI001892972A|nr:FHA domain-containing protein [Actinomyces trachealis]
MNEGAKAQFAPDSDGARVSRGTVALELSAVTAKEALESQEKSRQEWVLHAPCGSAVLDPRVSPEDAARVQTLLRELSAGLDTAPEDRPEPAGSVTQTESDRKENVRLSSQKLEPQETAAQAAAFAAAPTTLLAPSSRSAASAPSPQGSPDPVAAETSVWIDPDYAYRAPASDASAASAATNSDACTPSAHSARSVRSARSARSAASTIGDSAVVDLPERPEASTEAATEPSTVEPAPPAAPYVMGSLCVAGHLNPPGSIACLRCTAPVTPATVRGSRPPLARLSVSTGEVISVNGSVVVGRAPKEQNGPAQLVTVPSPTHLISRSHLLLTTMGWSVLACDLGSSNGTVLVRAGEAPVLIATALPTPLIVGDLLDIGDGVTLRLNAPA